MKRAITITVCLLSVLVFTRGSFAAAIDKTYSLADAGTLHVAVPAGWTEQSDGQTPPTIELRSPKNKHVSIQVTAIPIEMSEEKLKAAAQMIGERYAEGSTEKKVTLEEIKGDGVHGFVSSYTDPAKDPGEFRYVTAGVLLCNKTALAVTLLYNDKVSADHTAALAALKTFAITGGQAPADGQPALTKDLRVKSLDGTWTLVVPGKWHVTDDGKSPDGKSRQLSAVSIDGKTIMTLFLESAAKPKGDAKAAREFYLANMKRNPLAMEHLKQASVGEVATLEYDQGPKGFKQHNMNAYLSHAGIWVDLHVSNPEFNEKTDRPIWDELAKGLKAE